MLPSTKQYLCDCGTTKDIEKQKLSLYGSATK